jgi:hypothetical protein
MDYYKALWRLSSFTDWHMYYGDVAPYMSYLLFWIVCSGFVGLVVRMLVSGSRVRGFKPGRSRRIFFLLKKSRACLPSEGKSNNLSHVPTLGHVKNSISCSSLRADGKIRVCSFLPSLIEASRAAWCGAPLEMTEGTTWIWGTEGLSIRPRCSNPNADCNFTLTWIVCQDKVGEDRVQAGRFCFVVRFIYTGCPRRNVTYFGMVFLMLNYTEKTQNTYIQSWTVTEIMDIEKSGLLWCPRIVSCQLTVQMHARPSVRYYITY